MIAARKLSSAMSAAKAIADHLRDWLRGSCCNDETDWVSMAVYSTGNGYPSIPDDLFFSFPVVCRIGGVFSIVGGLHLSEQTERGIEKTVQELLDERNEALAFLESNKVGKLKFQNFLSSSYFFLVNLQKSKL